MTPNTTPNDGMNEKIYNEAKSRFPQRPGKHWVRVLGEAKRESFIAGALWFESTHTAELEKVQKENEELAVRATIAESYVDQLREEFSEFNGFKAYECTDCKTISIKKLTNEIQSGLCDNCNHPLWND